ncbi:MAG: hypothetical protein AB8G16_14865 [Gammaproteobacteria bacterium]
MSSFRSLIFSLGVLAAAGNAHGQVVNVDVGPVPAAYVGQGALDDPGNNFWSRITSSGFDLLESDGITPSGISVSLTSSNATAYEDTNSNGLLNDYVFTTTFDTANYVGDIEIAGLVANSRYLIYIYSAGRLESEGGLFELNGKSAATSGLPLEDFVEGANYVVLEVTADADGRVTGTYRPFDSFSSAAINGLQIQSIAPGTRPTRAENIRGAISPTVHSPGDAITVTAQFNEVVSLSQSGGLQLQLDIEGQMVSAVHTGATSGSELTFEAIAPSTTTYEAKVVADSLELLGGAALTDSNSLDVALTNAAAALDNDQISTQGLSVYPSVESLEPLASPHYAFRVREIANGNNWQTPFAWITQSIDFSPTTTDIGYYNAFVGGWSHTYANFEMANNTMIEVEITRLDPDTGLQVDIDKAVPHPRRKVRSWRVEDGRAYVIIDQPALLSVDIDGTFDDNPSPAAGFVNEDALHAVSIFANPFILDKPNPNDPDVLVVTPGTVPPEDGNWTTLYFEPGVHQIWDGDWEVGDDFQLHSDRSYYIPGNALVHGNFNNRDNDNDARNIRIFGHGTLSGDRIPHFDEQGLIGGEENPDAKWNRAIRVGNKAQGSRVEGVTVANPANHSVALQGGFSADPDNFNYVRWTKVITWRANGDGISPNGSGYAEDCFLRTQDDGTYIGGLGIRRMTYWADVNGMPLRLSNMLNDNPAAYRYFGPLAVEDIDVIYARTRFGSGPGRSIIGFPDPALPFAFNDGSHVIFRNIRVEDRFATRTLFGWDLASGSGGTGPISGVRFENVRAAARNVDNELDPLLGVAAAPISGLIFDDVTLAGEHYNDIADFQTNEFVSGFVFENTQAGAISYNGASGLGKWYIDTDWDAGVEPANNDVVNHTDTGTTLRVDASAYAGTLTVAHSDTASVRIENHGNLTVTDMLTLGGSGPGAVELIDGTLSLANEQNTALTIADGTLYFERGVLEWAGDQIDDLQFLFDSELITLGAGSLDAPVAGSVLIGRSGGNELYATFDATSGITQARVFSTADTDGDGVADALDNCTAVANPDQRDTNGDGFGNACDADLNNDCIVNVVDLGLLRSVFFTADEDADLNGDNVVNVIDLGLLRSGFFNAPGPATETCLPSE